MSYLELFIGFLKVGFFSFGGAYAAIPLIREVVLSYGWIDEEKLAYMIAVSESTPGPIMINLATYIGATQCGIFGALIATFAVILPSFFIVLFITAMMSKVIKNKYILAVIEGIKPCIFGVILATGCWMIIRNLFGDKIGNIDIRAIITTFVLGLIYFGSRIIFKKKMSPILFIAVSAVVGAASYLL